MERIQKSDDRIFLHKMERNSYSGKCRNWGIENGPIGKYILFLDADDTYSSDLSLQYIYDTIVGNDFPEIVKCSFNYVNFKNGTKKPIIFENRLENITRYEAPWTLASASYVCSRFVEGRKKFNDVIWNMSTIDSANSWAVVQHPIVDYHINENPLSLQYGNDKYDI